MPGGHGGPMAFLNKKYWHPGRLSNLETKWKKEQEAAQETKKLDELRKQLEEERQRDELHAVAEAAGVRKKEDRLDWMYQGGVAARQDADKRAEEAIMTGVIPDTSAEEPKSRAETLALLPTFYAEDTPASANETWARLHNDPLFAIKQQEIAARKKVLSNPMTMLTLKKEVAAVKEKKKDKKEKKDKKGKKEKKKRDRDSVSPEQHNPVHERSPEPEPKRSRKMSYDKSKVTRWLQSQAHEDVPPGRVGDREGDNSRYGHGNVPHAVRHIEDEEDKRNSRYTDSDGHHERRHQRGADGRSGRHRDDDKQRDRRHECSNDGRQDGRHREGERVEGKRQPHSRSARRGSRERDERHREHRNGERDDRRTDRRDGRRNNRTDEWTGGSDGGRTRDRAEPQVERASASHKDAEKSWEEPADRDVGRKYGLDYGQRDPDTAVGYDRSALAEATRKRLEEAAKRKAQEERDAAAARGVRREHQTGRLTEEQKAAKLAEMMRNAQEHEALRMSKIQEAAEAQQNELAQEGSRDAAKFLKTSTQALTSSGITAAEQIARRKHYSDHKSGFVNS